MADSTAKLDKVLLVSRYEDLEWIDDVSDFRCARCDHVLIHHYIANCGHKFCLNCRNVLGDGSRRWRCPLPDCNKTIEDIDLQDFEFERKVFELRAHCPNHNYGCPFVSQLKDIGAHLKTCSDTRERALPVLCEEANKPDPLTRAVQEVSNKLSQLSERLQAMSSALSEVKEEQEKQKAMWVEMERKWEDQERKWEEMDSRVSQVVSDIQEVSQKVPADVSSCSEIEKIKENAEEILKLKGKSEIWFQMMELKDDKHNKGMEQLKNKVEVIKNQVESSNSKQNFQKQQAVNYSSIKPDLQQLRIADEFYKKTPDFTWVIKDVNDLMYGNTTQVTSGVVPLKGYPFGAQAKLHRDKKDQIWFGLAYYSMRKSDWSPKIKLLPSVFWTLRDQSNGKTNIISCGVELFNAEFQYNRYSRFLFHSDLDVLNSMVYNMNDKWVIDIHVEALEVAQLTYSHDGSLKWTIGNYQKKLQRESEGLTECCFSPYFYTSLKGYRVQAHVFLNGNDKYQGRGLTVQINFMTGLYDANLANSFLHSTTVTVFNPTQPDRNITRSVEKDIKDDAWYNVNIGMHHEIDNLIHNGALHYKVTIEAT